MSRARATDAVRGIRATHRVFLVGDESSGKHAARDRESNQPRGLAGRARVPHRFLTIAKPNKAFAGALSARPVRARTREPSDLTRASPRPRRARSALTHAHEPIRARRRTPRGVPPRATAPCRVPRIIISNGNVLQPEEGGQKGTNRRRGVPEPRQVPRRARGSRRWPQARRRGWLGHRRPLRGVPRAQERARRDSVRAGRRLRRPRPHRGLLGRARGPRVPGARALFVLFRRLGRG